MSTGSLTGQWLVLVFDLIMYAKGSDAADFGIFHEKSNDVMFSFAIKGDLHLISSMMGNRTLSSLQAFPIEPLANALFIRW